jgi:ferrochelatase
MKASPPDAVLLMAHGGPESLDEVEPFLRRIMGDHPPSAAVVETIRERYRLIGGKSPLLDISRQQAAALEVALARQGFPARVHVGMRHAAPFIHEAVEQIQQSGADRIVALCLAPQYSSWSIGAYYRALDAACADAQITLVRVQSWHHEPLLHDAFADCARRAITGYAPDRILFTAHSLPDVPQDDPYPVAVRETAKGVAQRIGWTDVQVAYQSRGLRPGTWLGPDVEDAIREAAKAGTRRILVVPVGFVSDHVEILYDIDVLYRETAQSVGVDLRRTASLNTHPLFIQALAAVVQSHRLSPHPNPLPRGEGTFIAVPHTFVP